MCFVGNEPLSLRASLLLCLSSMQTNPPRSLPPSVSSSPLLCLSSRLKSSKRQLDFVLAQLPHSERFCIVYFNYLFCFPPALLLCFRFPPEIIEMPVGFLVETDDKNPVWALTGCTGFISVCLYICVDMCTYNFESKPTIQGGVES